MKRTVQAKQLNFSLDCGTTNWKWKKKKKK